MHVSVIDKRWPAVCLGFLQDSAFAELGLRVERQSLEVIMFNEASNEHHLKSVLKILGPESQKRSETNADFAAVKMCRRTKNKGA